MNGRINRLTPRQQEILRAVVSDYIQTFEPVGSRTLSRKYGLGLSPATIRNELSDLEEEGLLRQPHASAGRIPSDAGYRLFVDELLRPDPLGDQQQKILDSVHSGVSDLYDLLQQTAKITALVSGCTALVRAPRLDRACIKFIQLMPVGEADCMLVLLTDQGQITHQLVRLPESLSPEDLVVLGNFLNERLVGRPLDRLTEAALGAFGREISRYHETLETLYRGLTQARGSAADRLITSHQSYLAQQPEFHEVGKVGQILGILEEQQAMIDVLGRVSAQDSAESSVRITIGKEMPSPDLMDCSLVVATYRLGDRILGEVAVLGPTRMPYATAVAVVEAVAARLEQVLDELFGLDTRSVGGNLGRRRQA